MKGFKEIFNAYGGDYDTTMLRFMGKETMYLRFLDMFFDDDNFNKLEKALQKDDTAAAFEAAHALKGVVSNMGLTPLYKTVCAIVEPLRAMCPKSDYRALYKAIQEEFYRAEQLRRE